uniref:Uncharacterized protein n=1 Tax=Picea glauca TaxID=3330 RepID=A0A101M342_PICGL|nr:hypothetical protein ABT39_MTgene3235 [Picea glauca]
MPFSSQLPSLSISYPYAPSYAHLYVVMPLHSK